MPSVAFVGEKLVRKNKDRAGQIGLQRGVVIVAAENSILPREQIRVMQRKLAPVCRSRTRHAFADHKKIRIRDRLVIEPRLAPSSGVSLERDGEPLQRLQCRVLRQIGKGQTHVIGVVERIFRHGVALEITNNLQVSHVCALEVRALEVKGLKVRMKPYSN